MYILSVIIVIDMMMIIKYLVYLAVVFSDDYGYGIVEHRGYRELSENLESIKMEVA
tara:strand:- start:733 stop:900 length:168 start_codon:yes stop_codon:yes gene_type:complete